MQRPETNSGASTCQGRMDGCKGTAPAVRTCGGSLPGPVPSGCKQMQSNWHAWPHLCTPHGRAGCEYMTPTEQTGRRWAGWRCGVMEQGEGALQGWKEGGERVAGLERGGRARMGRKGGRKHSRRWAGWRHDRGRQWVDGQPDWRADGSQHAAAACTRTSTQGVYWQGSSLHSTR